ncbi:phage tail tape measure protein [Anaerosalibacter sp. Marseille-P3206]|uniref:phage tail tape measure protein n=1 Tax=Anaerosalibacter sp. Marseille-P3206 TaxID=1871005 RepID=UPI000987A633|nr:phage tail tape measure protein [Anaerosalibacter sp. Marseille-P3206]
MAKQINTVLSLKDKISQPLVKVSKNVDKVTREMKKSQNQIEKWKNKSVKAMDKVIKKSVKVGAAIGAAVGTIAVKVGFDGMKELDAASAKVKSIAGNSLDLKNIQEDLLKTSNKAGIAVEMLGDTQYSAISAGIKAKDSVMASVQASKLAVAGFTDSNSALSVMASTMNVFGMEGKKAMEDISDKLLVTQNLGVTDVQKLSESLGSVTPIAKSAGLSLDDVLGSVASLTKGGLETSQAMTSLKGMMSNVIKPSKQAQEEAQRLGLDFSVAAIKSKGFANWLEEVKSKTKGNTDSLGKLFGNVNALTGALALTGDGFEEFKEILGEVENSTGKTEEAYKTMTNTIGFKLDKMKNRFKNTFTSIMNTQSGAIGENIDKIDTWLENNENKIQQWVQSIGEGVTKIINFIKSVVSFIKKHEKAITTVGVFVLSMYSVIKVIGTAKKVLTGLNNIGMLVNGTLAMTPLGWLVLAIGGAIAAGYALYRNWDMVKEKAGDLGYGVVAAMENMETGLKNIFKGIGNFFIDWVINPIIKGLNMLSFDIPEWVPKFGGKHFGFNLKTVNKFEYEGFKSLKKGKYDTKQGMVTGGGKQMLGFAKGTSYSPAGYAKIHEEGGEIRKLSSGETIIPADKSDRLLKNKTLGEDLKVDVKIYGNIYGDDEIADKVGNTVYKKVKIALENV